MLGVFHLFLKRLQVRDEYWFFLRLRSEPLENVHLEMELSTAAHMYPNTQRECLKIQHKNNQSLFFKILNIRPQLIALALRDHLFLHPLVNRDEDF